MIQCHSSKNLMGGLRLDSSKALAGGLSGKAILPGKSAESLLVKMIGGQIEGKRMPMTGDPLSNEQIALIRRWIDDGASWPGESAGASEPDQKHWAYVPPVRPSLPKSRTSHGFATRLTSSSWLGWKRKASNRLWKQTERG